MTVEYGSYGTCHFYPTIVCAPVMDSVGSHIFGNISEFSMYAKLQKKVEIFG